MKPDIISNQPHVLSVRPRMRHGAIAKAGLLFLAVFVALVLFACGGDGNGDGTPTATVQVASTDAATSEPSVTITTPREGDSVPLGVTMSGESQGVAAGQVPDGPPPWVYVVLKPIPGDPNQSWWVQPYPLVGADGSWEAFVFAGIESDSPGTPFDVCAIVSDDVLDVGRFGGESPPALERDCVRVTRE